MRIQMPPYAHSLDLIYTGVIWAKKASEILALLKNERENLSVGAWGYIYIYIYIYKGRYINYDITILYITRYC